MILLSMSTKNLTLPSCFCSRNIQKIQKYVVGIYMGLLTHGFGTCGVQLEARPIPSKHVWRIFLRVGEAVCSIPNSQKAFWSWKFAASVFWPKTGICYFQPSECCLKIREAAWPSEDTPDLTRAQLQSCLKGLMVHDSGIWLYAGFRVCRDSRNRIPTDNEAWLYNVV